MRKALSQLVLATLATSSVFGSILLHSTSTQAQTSKTFNTNDTKVCRSRDDLRNLSRYVQRQQSFGASVEGVANWSKNGLQVPQATMPNAIVVSGDVMIRTNGLQVLVKNIDVTLPLLQNGNKGDYYNLATAVLKVRGLTNTGCMNAENKNQPFSINPRYDFAWQNVSIKRLSNQNSQTNDSSDDITAY
jgi:hypothetical protein